MGLHIRNFSREITYQKFGFQLPLTFKIGAAMDIMDIFQDESGIHSLEVAVDAIHPRDFSERINLGAEYWYNNMVALRCGYKFNHDVEGFSAGIGLKQKLGETQISVDYSFNKNDYLDDVSRFSVGLAF
jgi:hypothetical protein